MRPVGPRQELRPELAADKIWMVLQLRDLDKAVFLIYPGKHHVATGEQFPKGVVNFAVVTMPFANRPFSVNLRDSRPRYQIAVIKPEPHRAVFLSRFCK